MFQAHRDADQALANACGLALRFSQATVRGRGRVRDDGFGVTQIGRNADHLGAVDHMKRIRARCLGISAAHIKRHHGAALPGLLAHGQIMLRM